MSSSSGLNGKRGKVRLTRAGNNIDAFPFDRLSVDGAALAKMIISPLPNPNFASLRARDPLDRRDSTDSTMNSSDEELQSPKLKQKKQIFRLPKDDDPKHRGPSTNHAIANGGKHFEEVELSAKLSGQNRRQATHKQVSAANMTNETQVISTPSGTDRRSAQWFAGEKSPDPEANHSSRIFRRAGSSYESVKASSDCDTYYETYDSDGPDEEPLYKKPQKEYCSDAVSSSGWESVMSASLNDELPASSGMISSHRMASQSGTDGTVNVSPGFTEYTLGNNDYSYAVDPDGERIEEDNTSRVGEDIIPTPDGESSRQFVESSGGALQGSEYSSGSSGEEILGTSSESSNEELFNEESSSEDIETPPSSVSAEKLEPKTSPFPSNRLLTFMAVMIALVAIGLIASLTFFVWEKVSIDPICPPNDPCCSDPACSPPKPPQPPTPGSPGSPPTDGELLNLFESVVGEAARSDFTSAGMAANWMLFEDPGKFLTPRSNDAWIQRYLLVYTYYATTLNRATSWLSCNPPTEDELRLDDIDTCMFTYPTELPGGKIIYDLVPSHRWLSASDECQWGGVACGKTVEDEIEIGKAAQGSNISIKSTMKRLAVTSIILADQYLRGSIVTELAEMPNLKVLDLSHNGLQGTLSESFGSLETLRLQYNAIQGRIPSNLFNDKSVMKELNIGSNFMTGTIPNEVGMASSMTDLYLFKNKFTGPIPILGNMPLVNFHGHQNSFTGIMPFDYDFGGSWPDTLREWWVYENKLSGSLSENLGFVANLEDLRVNDNEITGTIPESIQDLQRLFRFDVQSNSLTGTVPETIGGLPQLRDVRLQFNNFGGVVPTSLCFLESMEVLEADCLAVGEPQTDCYCCTTCCNPELGSCQFY